MKVKWPRTSVNVLSLAIRNAQLIKSNQKLLLISLLIFFNGILVGYFGYGYLQSRELLSENVFFEFLDQPTALDFIINNIKVSFVAFLGGLLTLGLAAVFLLFLNGVVLGESVAVALGQMSPGEVFVKIAPHAIFEIPALLLAGAGGFLTLKIVIALLQEKRVNYKNELLNAGWLAITVVLLLVVAGMVEGNVTPALAELLYGTGE